MKMVSRNKIKGGRTQREGMKMLESQGWLVSIVERTSRFAKEKDLWGLFDVACIRDNELKFVQFCTNTLHTIKSYKKFALEHPVPNVSWELWCRKDKKHFKDRWDIRVFK